MTCQHRPGGWGQEQQDAASYKAWKIDYLKYDNCFGNGLDWIGLDWIGESKRPDTVSTNARCAKCNDDCEWGIQHPASWARPIGNSLRTTGDIQNNWKFITNILDQNNRWHE